jgi:hypothetical protein
MRLLGLYTLILVEFLYVTLHVYRDWLYLAGLIVVMIVVR